MDQVKQYLSVAAKYHFWIVAGLITVIFIGCWWVAAGQLEDQFQQRKSTIESQQTAAQSLSGQATHPNAHSNREMDLLINELKEEVKTVWSAQYNRQQDILTWPQELPAEMIARVEQLQPIEAKVPYPVPPSEEIPQRFREAYMNYIGKELPILAEIIDARWAISTSSAQGGSMAGGYPGGGGAMFSGGAGMGPGMMGGGYGGYGGMQGAGASRSAATAGVVVDWSPSSQQSIAARFNLAQAPSTLELLYRQEDLWVLTGIMNIIAKTNEGADYQYQATVKTLEFVDIGRRANPRAGQVTRPSAQASGGMGMGMPGYGEGGYDMSMSGEMASGGEPASGAAMGVGELGMPGANPYAGTSTAAPDPANYRYVDNEYQPLPAEQLRGAMTSANPSPENAFLVVAKRMPVRMRMMVDQRKLPRLLAECGNADLPLEIRQVRINTPSGQSAGGMGGMGGEMMSGGGYGGEMMSGPGALGGFGGDMGMSGEMGLDDMGEMGGGEDMYGEMMSGGGEMMSGGYGGMSGYGGGAGMGRRQGANPYDVTVELYGIIYIYNPPQIDQLAVEQVDAKTAEEMEEADAKELADRAEAEAAADAAAQQQAAQQQQAQPAAGDQLPAEGTAAPQIQQPGVAQPPAAGQPPDTAPPPGTQPGQPGTPQGQPAVPEGTPPPSGPQPPGAGAAGAAQPEPAGQNGPAGAAGP